MKKLIAIYLGIALVREVAKYYKIKSFEDVMNLVLPSLEDLLPKQQKTKVKQLHSATNKHLEHA
ncbi:MAG: hypothetical protein JWO32_709 [Bacteroidetes bacterium]|nr:hypothetical protein [Bacteroidota bacterium]